MDPGDRHGDKIHLRQFAKHGGRFDQILEADVVGGEGFREVTGKARMNERNRAWCVAIGGGINENEPGVVAEISKQVKPAGAAVHEFGARAQPRSLQPPDGMDPDTLVAEEEIADAENQRKMGGRFQG